jgi:LEA14-like dessication related protein
MGEKTLRIGLILLTIALTLGPILVALIAHGWDFQAVATPDPNLLEGLTSSPPEMIMENIGLLGFENTVPFDPSHHYVHSWEESESQLENDLGNAGTFIIGHVDLGNAGAYAGHAPWPTCAGCTTPDYDNADPDKDCVSPNDGIAPVFEFNDPPGSLTLPLPMDIPEKIVEHDPVNAIVVRSSLESIRAAFTDAGWDFYYPDEGFLCPEPHTPMGEVADAFLNIGDHQHHVRIFYGGNDSTYGDWYYMGAHYEGQNEKPIIGARVSLTNSYTFPITVENVTFDILCSVDNVQLGQGGLYEEVVIQSGSLGTFDIVVEFTLEGINHLLNNHADYEEFTLSSSFDISSKNGIQVGVYEIMIKMPFDYSNIEFDQPVVQG